MQRPSRGSADTLAQMSRQHACLELSLPLALSVRTSFIPLPAPPSFCRPAHWPADSPLPCCVAPWRSQHPAPPPQHRSAASPAPQQSPPPEAGRQCAVKLKGNKASVVQRSVVQPPAQRPRNLLHLKGAGKEEVLLSACHSPTRKRSTASTLSVQAEKLASTSSLSAELSRQACPLETHTQCLPA